MLVAAGASKVDFVSKPDLAQNGGGYDHVLLPDGVGRPSALTGHRGVGSHTWYKQCLIAGRLLPPALMDDVPAGGGSGVAGRSQAIGGK